jgi:predicted metal-dependent phosphoesterase TrpH
LTSTASVITQSPVPLSSTPRRLAAALALSALALASTACGPSLVGGLMLTAYRPDPIPKGPGPAWTQTESPPRRLLAGDLHCHVFPPDPAFHVDREPAETVERAAAEGLDFLVLTPHVGAGFFTNPGQRSAVLADRARLRAEVERQRPKTTFIFGMEYTDGRYGHVGVAFADLEAVLAEVPVEVAANHPEHFFERFVQRGGLLTINHPLVTRLDSIVSEARADRSWRPFTTPGPFPPEIQAIDRLAQGVEVYNLAAAHLRDRILLHDSRHTLVATLARLDREIVARGRRMTPVGGSDSHTHHLRATTFVWSRGATEAEIREGIAEGRVCVRSHEACSFEARAPGGAWVGVGGAVSGASLEARASGDDVEVLLDGVRAATPASGAIARVALPEGRCAVVRARVGEGYSAPIYANCPFAPAR